MVGPFRIVSGLVWNRQLNAYLPDPTSRAIGVVACGPNPTISS